MNKSLLNIIVTLVIGVLVGFGGFYAYNKINGEKTPNTSSVSDKQKVQDLLDKVGKLIILPSEQPQIFTIIDASALIKSDSFYKNTKNGDVSLFYEKSMKEIIYSPERNIIVNAGPVFLRDNKAQASGTDMNNSTSTATTTKKK